ncbi:MAG: hypothetical protein LBV31_01860 [Prevotellaceae bacterium]|jgi:hypothetical protein|nr:hypothetical protein [Prevotellaceae bacterium]
MKKYLFLLMIALVASTARAQVGINTENPNIHTTLDIVSPNNNQGIMIPRMTETERNQINTTAAENSLLVYNTTEDCFNYYSKTAGEWQSLCGGVSKAVFDFTPNCNRYAVEGAYIKSKPLDNSNYLIIEVDVQKAGAYVINVDACSAPNASNGYGFTGTGTFLSTGLQTVRLAAQGKPANVHSHATDLTVGDALQFHFQGVDRTSDVRCTQLVVRVLPDIADYSINCSSIMVNGIYSKDTLLNSSNTITFNVTVATTGSYDIAATSTQGVSFHGRGNFTSTGTTLVTLYGEGAPTVNADIPVTIQSNSESGNTTCATVLPITFPAMTYAIIGTGVYSWHTPRSSAFNGDSFGLQGKVKMRGFNQLWETFDITLANTKLTTGHNGKMPDIVLYFSYGAAPTTALSNTLSNYVNNGGVLIYGTTDGNFDQANIMLTGIFGANAAHAQAQTAVTNGSGDDNDYQINNQPLDPIINGPFGNLAGRYWGEDNATTGSIVVTQMPANSVQICPASNAYGHITVNPEYSIVWYNDRKNFVYFGDSTGATHSEMGTGDYPSLYSSTGSPLSKAYGVIGASGSGHPFVYNSALELNAVAWGIRKAANSGINPY